MGKLTKIILAVILLCAPAFAGNNNLIRQQQQQQQQGPVVHEHAEGEENHPHVSRAMFTTRISNNEPVSDLVEIESDFSQVFFFTELMECTDCVFIHTWYYNGVYQFETEAYSEWPRFRYWSSVDGMDATWAGQWRVEAIANGEVMAEREFTYYQPSQQQQKTRGIDQRLEEETLSECETNLRYFSDKSREEPDEPYFQFMLKKWGERCLDAPRDAKRSPTR